MYKRIFTVLAFVSLLIALFGATVTPADAARKSVALVSVGYYHEKGVVFNFKLTGDFQDSELKGSLKIGKNTIKVYCKRKDDDELVNALCVAPSTTAQYAGRKGIITFAGASFTVTIPARPQK
ncbi:MAG: hypothetical protein N2117_03680 [Anaerolineales bacterium]|nr:hypothetical protein [Anaerolineales bacterium]MCX7754332.1 hypothetical protein [Anaerolineales bacterium]MDW8279065.1 hypothetical protein [Anaerolineales bacterium]